MAYAWIAAISLTCGLIWAHLSGDAKIDKQLADAQTEIADRKAAQVSNLQTIERLELANIEWLNVWMQTNADWQLEAAAQLESMEAKQALERATMNDEIERIRNELSKDGDTCAIPVPIVDWVCEFAADCTP